MDRARTTDATWSPLEAIPVFFMAVGMVLLTLLLLPRPTRTRDPFCGGRFLVTAIALELAFAASVLVWVRYVHKGNLAALGAPQQPWRDVVAGAAAGIAVVIAGGATLILLVELIELFTRETPTVPEQVPACVRGGVLAAAGPAVVLLAPLGEELFFRGFLYKGLRRRMPVWGAVIVSSVLFGLVHERLLLIPPLFVVGAGLALVYERRQSLLAPMVAHAVFNVFGFWQIARGRL